MEACESVARPAFVFVVTLVTDSVTPPSPPLRNLENWEEADALDISSRRVHFHFRQCDFRQPLLKKRGDNDTTGSLKWHHSSFDAHAATQKRKRRERGRQKKKLSRKVHGGRRPEPSAADLGFQIFLFSSVFSSAAPPGNEIFGFGTSLAVSG